MKLIHMINTNLKFIAKATVVVSSALYSAITIGLSFISWDDIGIDSIRWRILILVGIFLLSILLSMGYILAIRKKYVVWKKGNGSISVCYGDILNKTFLKKHRKKIIVIPVNTCFDTIVDDDIANVNKPLVSGNTIHGKWVKHMLSSINFQHSSLNKDIEQEIQKKNIKPEYIFDIKDKERGNLNSYHKGTILSIAYDEQTVYWLLALSEFNCDNNAQSSRKDIRECVEKLIDYYNKNGQGYDIYLPLIGTGLSRAGLSYKESLETIVMGLRFYNDKVHGNVNVVIYHGDKEWISIFDV